MSASSHEDARGETLILANSGMCPLIYARVPKQVRITDAPNRDLGPGHARLAAQQRAGELKTPVRLRLLLICRLDGEDPLHSLPLDQCFHFRLQRALSRQMASSGIKNHG